MKFDRPLWAPFKFYPRQLAPFALGFHPRSTTRPAKKTTQSRELSVSTNLSLASVLVFLCSVGATIWPTSAVCKQSENIPLAANAVNSSIAGATTSAARAQEEVDHDGVISASEILQNPIEDGGGGAQRGGLSWPKEDSAERWRAGGGGHEGSEASGQQSIGQQQEQTSRLLLQLLVLGLLTLVSFSLAIIYAIKYCVCHARRKRNQQHSRHQRCPGLLLRRALVGDSSCGGQQQLLFDQQQLAQLAATQASGEAMRVDNSATQMLLASAECAFSPSGPHPLLAQAQHRVGRGDTSAQQRARNLQDSAQIWTTSASGCPACPAHANAPLLELSAPLQQGVSAQNQRPPPAYAELFGTAPCPPPHLGAGPPLVPGNENQLPPARPPSLLRPNTVEHISALSSPSEPPSTSTSGIHSTTTTSTPVPFNQDQRPANLLVRLNLNKTKLLSAADLMLLSKLIDVPIVMSQQDVCEGHEDDEEEEQVPQSNGGQRSGGAVSSLRANDGATSADEDEQEEEAEERQQDQSSTFGCPPD